MTAHRQERADCNISQIISAKHAEFWLGRCLGVIGQQLGILQKTQGDNLDPGLQ